MVEGEVAIEEEEVEVVRGGGRAGDAGRESDGGAEALVTLERGAAEPEADCDEMEDGGVEVKAEEGGLPAAAEVIFVAGAAAAAGDGGFEEAAADPAAAVGAAPADGGLVGVKIFLTFEATKEAAEARKFGLTPLVLAPAALLLAGPFRRGEPESTGLVEAADVICTSLSSVSSASVSASPSSGPTEVWRGAGWEEVKAETAGEEVSN